MAKNYPLILPSEKRKYHGFTLVELMITMAISGIVIAAIYSAYISQQRTYLAQEQVAEMQQNIRAAMDIMTREIRMAGYDPTRDANAGITTAQVGQISFTLDIIDTSGATPFVSDGKTDGPGEIIDFGFSADADQDNDRNGIPDIVIDGVPMALHLGRQTGGAGGYEAIAENFQAIEFRYLDNDGNVTTTLDDIRVVQISLLARAAQEDRNFTDTTTYTTASGIDLGPFNDNYRRRFQITTVQLRNMGL
jgi:type IV pilus assembly protein PilW